MGLFGTTGLCLPDHHRAAVLHLCYDGNTFGFSLLDAGSILSLCFINKHCSAGLSFPCGAVQRAFASLMALVVSDSFWQRAISKSESCFLQQALREDLVASRHLKALPASSWSWTTSPGRTLAPSPKVPTSIETSSRVGLSSSASSGMLTCGDT